MVNGEAHNMKTIFSNRYNSELEMAQVAAQGDQNAKRDLVGLVLDQVRRTMSYLSGSERDAEDLAQMALIQILNSAGSFRVECRLKYWAERIAVRTAMKHFRKRQRREKLTVSWFSAAPEHSDIDVEQNAALGEARVRIAEHMQKLSFDRRTAIVLCHVQGYGIAEIANITGAPINTVRDRLRVGRQQLKKRILSDPSLGEWVGTGTK